MRPLLLLVVLLSATTACLAELRIQTIDRKINLQSQFVKVTQTIKFKNTASSAVSSFDLCTLSNLAARESLLKVTEGKSKKDLKVDSGVKTPTAGVSCHTVTFSSPLAAGETLGIDTTVIYTKVQTPKPVAIKQGEKQFMVYVDNLYVVSPYHVAQQNTEVLLPSREVLSYTQNKASLSSSTLKYGRFDSVKPFTLESLDVHYESSKAFIQVLKLEKEVQVSHWGNIYYEETYELKNAGAAHTGPFSRLKHSQMFRGSGNFFRELVGRLPQNAHSLYYKDLIGNISTSNVRKTPTSTLITFETRYPLLGGWKVDFFLGWSVPLDKSLFQLGWGKLQLRTSFGASVDGAQVDELVLKVVLPEGSKYIGDNLPFDVERNQTTKFTYLDTTGRPVLVYRKLNVVPDHNVQFDVDYEFNNLSLLREPLLLIGAFAAFFATVVVINRLDLTISKDDQWKEGQKKEQLSTLMSGLTNKYTELEVGVEKLNHLATSAKDVDSAQSERAVIEGGIRATQATIDELLASLKGISARLAGQVEEEVDRKAAALKEKASARISSKLDLLRKGASAAEVAKKEAEYKPQLAQLSDELTTAINRLFGQY